MAAFSDLWRSGKSREKRLIDDRRWCRDRRIDDLSVSAERRSGEDRRSEMGRRDKE
jgi:hypothetical protein